MKKRFAKAPWGFMYEPYTSQDGKDIPNYTIYSCEDEVSHDKVCDTNENAPAKMQEANALLISAAPELLEALELCLERLEINNIENSEAEAINTAKAAIASAYHGCA